MWIHTERTPHLENETAGRADNGRKTEGSGPSEIKKKSERRFPRVGREKFLSANSQVFEFANTGASVKRREKKKSIGKIKTK